MIIRAGTATFLRHLGENSIVIYLAFFFPMGVSRVILLKLGVFDIGTTSLIVTIVSVVSPLILLWLIGRVDFGWFLFRRPAMGLSQRHIRKAGGGSASRVNIRAGEAAPI